MCSKQKGHCSVDGQTQVVVRSRISKACQVSPLAVSHGAGSPGGFQGGCGGVSAEAGRSSPCPASNGNGGEMRASRGFCRQNRAVDPKCREDGDRA